MIHLLNPILRGWRNYFALCNLTRPFWKQDFYVTARFYRVWRKASQRPSKILKPGVYAVLHKMALYSLAQSWRPANA